MWFHVDPLLVHKVVVAILCVQTVVVRHASAVRWRERLARWLSAVSRCSPTPSLRIDLLLLDLLNLALQNT